MRGEDYRGRGGGARISAPVLGMKDIINIMGNGKGGDPISKRAHPANSHLVNSFAPALRL